MIAPKPTVIKVEPLQRKELRLQPVVHVRVESDASAILPRVESLEIELATETQERDSADSNLLEQIGVLGSQLATEIQERDSADSNLLEQITDVQTLAQTNQLNLGSKADQVDLDATNVQVETNRLAILTKADTTALETSVANRVRFDVATQTLTLIQQQNARTNIGAEEVGTAAALVAAITPAAIGAATAAQGAKADTALQSADVAPVALSGSYTALIDKPTLLTLASLLTGLTAGSNAAITATDSLITAFAKLQAQASANAANISTNSNLLAPVPRKIGSSWYVSGNWYDAEYPRYAGASAGAVTLGRTFYIPRQILETATFTSLAFYCSTGAASAVAYAGVCSDNNGQPGDLLVSFSADCSTTGVKSSSISLSLTAGQIVWDVFLMVGGVAQIYRYNVTRALPDQGGANANSVTFRYKSGQTDLAATATGTSMGQASVVPRLMLQAV